jgi:KaiC/GvpD/RAD55 family RecA-like ATPase
MYDDRTDFEKELEIYEKMLPKQEKRAIQSLRLRDIPRGIPPSYIIDGYIPSASTVLLTGEAGTGKTTIAASWASAVTNGSTWCGKNVMQGNVLYILLEDSQDQCTETMRKFGMNEDNFFMLSQVSPLKAVLHSAIFGSIKLPENTAELLYEVRAIAPTLIIVDAVTRLVGGKSSKIKEDIAMIFADLCRETGIAMVLLNHVKPGYYNEKNVASRIKSEMFHELARVSFLMKYSLEKALHELAVIKANVPGIQPIVYSMYESLDTMLHIQPIGMHHDMLLLSSGVLEPDKKGRILGCLSLYGPSTPIQVCSITGINYSTVRVYLHEMVKNKIIEYNREKSLYALPSNTVTPMDFKALSEVQALQQQKTNSNAYNTTSIPDNTTPTQDTSQCNTKTFLFDESTNTVKTGDTQPDNSGKEETPETIKQPEI